MEVYSAVSQTKAAFSGRAIQSLKHIIYRHIEDHGENSFTKYLNLCLQGIVTSIDRLGNLLEMSRILITSQFCTINL